MTNTWHDFSQQAELTPVAPVIGVVTEVAASMDMACLIAGAFARNLLGGNVKVNFEVIRGL